jgi:hypothetical protein
MQSRNASIDGKVLDIITEEEYSKQYKMYLENPSICSMTALEVNNNDQSYLLPFRGKTDDRPGIYPDGCVYFVKFPQSDEEESVYNKNNIDIVDFTNMSNINDFLEKNNQIREMENLALSDSDEIFVPPISGNETEAMKAFKQAIIAKHMDVDRYSARFGENYLNDKRILKGDDITMNKLISICNKFDIEAKLTLSDKHSDVANPMGTSIEVVLTDKYVSEED